MIGPAGVVVGMPFIVEGLLIANEGEGVGVAPTVGFTTDTGVPVESVGDGARGEFGAVPSTVGLVCPLIPVHMGFPSAAQSTKRPEQKVTGSSSQLRTSVGQLDPSQHEQSS